MSLKFNLLLEVKEGITAAANKPVFPSDEKGNSIRRSRPLSAQSTSPTRTSSPRPDMY